MQRIIRKCLTSFYETKIFNFRDGLDVQVSLEVASTTKALNNEAAINVSLKSRRSAV